MRTPVLAQAAIALVLLAVSCGGKGSGGNGLSASPAKPSVTVPSRPAPTTLQIRDITVGDGPMASPGHVVTIQYVGVSYSTGREFASSWDRAEPLRFPLGQGQVIPGWERGVNGMKVGGRRELIVPPDLAYGEAGAPPEIGPNETLIFVIDLVDVR